MLSLCARDFPGRCCGRQAQRSYPPSPCVSIQVQPGRSVSWCFSRWAGVRFSSIGAHPMVRFVRVRLGLGAIPCRFMALEIVTDETPNRLASRLSELGTKSAGRIKHLLLNPFRPFPRPGAIPRRFICLQRVRVAIPRRLASSRMVVGLKPLGRANPRSTALCALRCQYLATFKGTPNFSAVALAFFSRMAFVGFRKMFHGNSLLRCCRTAS